jgi:hypothetical protein
MRHGQAVRHAGWPHRTTLPRVGHVKLEWEVKPLGAPFDGTGPQQGSTRADSGTGYAALAGEGHGLALGEYHWRARGRHLAANDRGILEAQCVDSDDTDAVATETGNPLPGPATRMFPSGRYTVGAGVSV